MADPIVPQPEINKAANILEAFTNSRGLHRSEPVS